MPLAVNTEWFDETVVLTTDVVIDSTISIRSDTPLFLTTETNTSYTISRGVSDIPLFELNGSNLRLSANGTGMVTIDGMKGIYSSNKAPLFHQFNQSSLMLDANTLITDNMLVSAGLAFPGEGAVYSEGGSSIILSGGSISQNEVLGGNDGVYLENSSGMSMRMVIWKPWSLEPVDGDHPVGYFMTSTDSPMISGNSATNPGGGIFLSDDADCGFDLISATVLDNTAPLGAGIYVGSDSWFSLSDTGTVSGDNVVYLNSGVMINVVGNELFAPSGVYCITLPSQYLTYGQMLYVYRIVK